MLPEPPRPRARPSGMLGLLEGERMWIEPRGFEEIHSRGNQEQHRLQDPSKWVPYGVGAIEGEAPSAAGAQGGHRPPRTATAAAKRSPTPGRGTATRPTECPPAPPTETLSTHGLPAQVAMLGRDG